MGYHDSKTAVSCRECGVEWLKAPATLKEWQGRCKSCAGKRTGHLSIPKRVTCSECNQRTATAKTNPCAKCNRTRHTANAYHKTSRVTVQCRDCGTEWQKSKYTLSEWGGRCRSCAQSEVSSRRSVSRGRSERASEQIAQQGGIPNAHKFTSERTRDENNVNWKGGITPLRAQVRQMPEYKQWRLEVFERDQFTCLLCNEPKSGHLHADHYPIPYSKLIEQMVRRSVEPSDFTPLWDTSNGRTLCVECHNQYGWRPGREAVPH